MPFNRNEMLCAIQRNRNNGCGIAPFISKNDSPIDWYDTSGCWKLWGKNASSHASVCCCRTTYDRDDNPRRDAAPYSHRPIVHRDFLAQRLS